MPISTETHAAFCRNLRARRIEAGLTQVDLAKRLGVSQPSVAQLETGEYVPSLDIVDRVAKALRVPPETLLSQALAAI